MTPLRPRLNPMSRHNDFFEDHAGIDFDEFVDRKMLQPWEVACLNEKLSAIRAGDFDSPAERKYAREEADILAGRPVFLIGASHPWVAADVNYDPASKKPCPGCADRPLPPDSICLVCSASHGSPEQRPMKGEILARQREAFEKADRRMARLKARRAKRRKAVSAR